jgi:hypothetical protein
VRRLNDLELWVAPQKPRRHQERCELRLRVTRRHVNNQPLQLPARHALELFGNDPVMLALDEVLVHVMRKGHKAVGRLFTHLELLLGLRERQDLLQHLVR